MDLFKEPVLQQTASQHPPDNFPMSENTEENCQVFSFIQKMIGLEYKEKDQIPDLQADTEEFFHT